jgi:hypothetical protein
VLLSNVRLITHEGAVRQKAPIPLHHWNAAPKCFQPRELVTLSFLRLGENSLLCLENMQKSFFVVAR